MVIRLPEYENPQGLTVMAEESDMRWRQEPWLSDLRYMAAHTFPRGFLRHLAEIPDESFLHVIWVRTDANRLFVILPTKEVEWVLGEVGPGPALIKVAESDGKLCLDIVQCSSVAAHKAAVDILHDIVTAAGGTKTNPCILSRTLVQRVLETAERLGDRFDPESEETMNELTFLDEVELGQMKCDYGDHMKDEPFAWIGSCPQIKSSFFRLVGQAVAGWLRTWPGLTH